jgi:glycerol-3-phosphate dehydrogenase
MKREALLARLRSTLRWDVLVIGGGATGLGCAVDAAARGYTTLLLEAHDFAKGTSSRSTKLIHGGVRYLAQGRLGLVREALEERAILLANAPHLVHPQRFVVPVYRQWDRLMLGVGLTAYDWLAGSRSLGASRLLSARDTVAALPGVRQEGLVGGIAYMDARFDDARLAITLMRSVFDLGGLAINYLPVTALRHEAGRVVGADARDAESGACFNIAARVVINAGGVWADTLRQLDEPQAPAQLAPSQGAHLVLDRDFLPTDSALLIPHTPDGRVLFAIPWKGKVLLGTTDTPRTDLPLEPRPLAGEIDFILETAGRYLARPPRREDVRSAFAGLRPLIGSTKGGEVGIRPALMIGQAAAGPRALGLFAQERPQSTPEKAVERAENPALGVFEVVEPAPQHRIQTADDLLRLRPSVRRVWLRIFVLQRLQALVAHPAPSRLEAVAQELEALAHKPAVAHMGLVRMQLQTFRSDPRTHHVQRMDRLGSAPAQNHEVVGVTHHRQTQPGQLHVQIVQVQIRQQRADHRTLRRAARRRPALQLLHHVLFDPAIQQGQQATVADVRRQPLLQPVVRNAVEVPLQVGIHHMGVARLQQPSTTAAHPCSCVPGRNPKLVGANICSKIGSITRFTAACATRSRPSGYPADATCRPPSRSPPDAPAAADNDPFPAPAPTHPSTDPDGPQTAPRSPDRHPPRRD